jgi:hypothetical protein
MVIIPRIFTEFGEGMFRKPAGPPDILFQYHIVNLKISDVKRVKIEKYTPLVLMMAVPRIKATRALIKPPSNIDSQTESPKLIDSRPEPYAPTSMNPAAPNESSPVRLIMRKLEVRRILIQTKQRICIQ